MKSIKRIFSVTAAILLAGQLASAQEISTSLPLTSIGDRLMWAVGDQNLSLNVPLTGQVKLELYSARIDPKDYRSDTYYGDETYSPEAVSTTFTLLREDGSVVMTRTFTPGEQTWETLFDQELPAGNYRVRAETKGNGKNTFAVRLAGVSAALSADSLTVNVHSADWTPVLNVTTDGDQYTLRMYDGDGPKELEARLRDSAGHVYPMTVSADRAWSDLPLPAAAGHYTVELRQPATAKQYSNTVSFALNRQGTQTPITISKVDQTGLLRVSAELVLPTGSLPTNADVLVGHDPLKVDGQTEKTVAAGTYPVSVADVAGAKVSLSSSQVEVPKNGVGEVKVQVRPDVALSLQSDKTEVCVGDTVTLTARATTAFAGKLPLDLSLETPGLTLSGEGRLTGDLSADQPGELRLTGKATQAGPLTITAKLAPWEQGQTLKLNVRPDATSLQLSRSPLADAQVGDEVVVRLSITNTADQPVPYQLADQTVEGLQALDSTSFTGTLAAGETREVSYRAKVTQAGAGQLALQAKLDSPACPAPQQVAGTLNVVVPAPEVHPAPAQSRRSTVTIPFDAPSESLSVVIGQALPAGATLVAGSSKLDGQPIADPKKGASGTLYWTVPAPAAGVKGAALRGVVTYDLSHTDALDALPSPSLSVSLPAGRSEVLQGSLNAQDLAGATKLADANVLPQLDENEGAIKLPLKDTVVRIRDRISVTVEAPIGEIPTLTVNGQPVSNDLIGTNTQDGVRGVQRLTFVGVPIQSGPNVLRFLNQELTVMRVGATQKIDVIPVSTVADGSTPVRLKLRAYDAYGNLTDQSSVTLKSNLEPRTPDANTTESGYQVKLVDGEGIVEFQPQSSPITLKMHLLQDQTVMPYSVDITPDNSRVGVGVLTATAGLNSNFSVQNDVTWQAHAYYESPLAGGKVYIAADKDKLPTDENTLLRSPVYGDASTETVPLQGIDPVALTYDHPNFRVDYRQNSLPIDVLPINEQITALTAYSKTNPQLSGFVAAIPVDHVIDMPLVPEGNRLLKLPEGNISEGSETLVLVTLEPVSGKEIKRVTLIRNADYVLDPKTGVITLTRALDRVDSQLNEQVVYASYRVSNPLSKRSMAYGVQLKTAGQNYTAGVAVVSLDQNVTYGARATYDNGTTRADGLVAYSHGLQASAAVMSTPNDRNSFSAKIRYQQAGYDGLGESNDGLNANANYTTKITDRLGVVVDAEYHSLPTAASGVTGLLDPNDTRGGSITGRAEYRLAPFTVGAGAHYAFGDQYGLGAVGSLGYHTDNINVDVIHTQPLSGNLDTTTEATARFKVSRNVTLGFTDKMTWGIGQAATLTLDSALGNVNYALGYELPTAGGAGNRARFGVTTALPLSSRVGLGLHGSALYDFAARQPELGVGGDLNYKADTLSATVGTDLTYRQQQFGVVVRGGITGTVTDHLTLTADGLAEYAPAVVDDSGKTTMEGKNGQRFSLGYAYRNRTLNSLGYVRYVNGSLAGGIPELDTGASAEYRQPTWSVRTGIDTRTLLLDKSSYTWQAYVGGTAYVTDWFGVGAWARLMRQPALGNSQTGYGVEGSLRALPGTWLTAGYNFKGFDGLTNASTYTKQGAYVRLDVTLDETLGSKR